MNDITAWWGAGTGTVGLVLSVYNAWHTRRLTRPDVIVEPRFTASIYDDAVPSALAVHVVNRSGFEITIMNAAIVARDESGKPGSMLRLEGFSNGLPMQLAARSSTDIQLTLRTTIALAMDQLDHVFVELATGERFRSSKRHPYAGKTLKEIQRHRNEHGNP